MHYTESMSSGGDKPRTDHSAEREDNCCSATLVASADDAIAALNDIVTGTVDKVAYRTRKALRSAVILIYSAICELIRDGGAEFLATRGVKAHGNTDNPYQPYMRAFTKETHAWVRSAVCKYAQVFWLAQHLNIPPGNFGAWLETQTVEGACAEYRQLMRERRRSERNEKLAKVLVDPEKEPEKAPLLSGTPVTLGCKGLKLAVVNCVSDGSGNFRLLGILHHDHDAIVELVLADTPQRQG